MEYSTKLHFQGIIVPIILNQDFLIFTFATLVYYRYVGKKDTPSIFFKKTSFIFFLVCLRKMTPSVLKTL